MLGSTITTSTLTFSSITMSPAVFSSNITTTFNSSILINIAGTDYLLPLIKA
jgi:hypothetical protein